jgi:hypothetical protein
MRRLKGVGMLWPVTGYEPSLFAQTWRRHQKGMVDQWVRMQMYAIALISTAVIARIQWQQLIKT